MLARYFVLPFLLTDCYAIYQKELRVCVLDLDFVHNALVIKVLMHVLLTQSRALSTPLFSFQGSVCVARGDGFFRLTRNVSLCQASNLWHL